MLAATLFGFASCKDDELLVPGDCITDEMRDAYFIIGNQVATRTTHVNDEYTVFDNGDEIGAFALTDDGENTLDGEPKNVCYTVAELSNSEPNDYGYKARVLLPKDNKRKLSKGLAKYLFYYPYNPDIKELDDLKNLTHKVYADQTEHDNYIKSDLLWDVAFGEEDKCLIMMDHAMANIIISIDGVEYDAEKGAEIIDMPLIAGGVNLTAPNLAEMTAPDGNFAYSNPLELEGQDFSDIKAKQVQYTSSTDKFRAAVPANCTLEGGKDIIRLWTKGNNSQPKVFKLKKDVTLEPGKNYIFTLIKKGKPQPDVTDEDSWVLDVLDPETGDVVGLLCREYIRYQPQHTLTNPDTNEEDNSDNYKPDQITFPNPDEKPLNVGGGEIHETLTGLSMSSQAWVFYNMDDNGEPDLTKGQIMRVIYDVRVNTRDKVDAMPAWPYPYTQDQGFSILKGGQSVNINLTDHGHNWIFADGHGRSTKEYGEGDNDYGADSKRFEKDQGYYEFWQKFDDGYYYTMHGSIIKWCPKHNLIYELITPPEKANRVSNIVATNQGHIAIPENENDKPYVSFEPISGTRELNNEDIKVGYTMPHYLIDTRETKDGKLETTRYPLVKIGYNQFWMSKSLKIKTLNNKEHTPLVDYTYNGKGLNYFQSGGLFGCGYVYPFTFMNAQNSNKQNWDVELLYNTICLLNENFVPKSNIMEEKYIAPSKKHIKRLWQYVGWRAFNKLMTGNMTGQNDAYKLIGKNPPSTEEEALVRGFVKESNGRCGNISGFNLGSSGYRAVDQDGKREANSGKQMPLLLYPTAEEDFGKNVIFVGFTDGDFFEANANFSKMFSVNEGMNYDVKGNQTGAFAPIRLFLRFKLQEEKPCACSAHSSLINQAQAAKSPATRSGAVETSVSRNVYVEIVSD